MICHPERSEGSAFLRSGTDLPASLHRPHPRPNLRPPKQRNPDIPMHLQRVAFGRHRPSIRMSRLRIVHIPIHQMVRVRSLKLRSNHQPTQRPSPQRSIRILRIDRRRRRRLQLHDLHAALRPTRINRHHRPRSRLPITHHPTRRISEPTPPKHHQNPKPSHSRSIGCHLKCLESSVNFTELSSRPKRSEVERPAGSPFAVAFLSVILAGDLLLSTRPRTLTPPDKSNTSNNSSPAASTPPDGPPPLLASPASAPSAPHRPPQPPQSP